MEDPLPGDVQILLTSKEDSVSMRSLGAQHISKLVKISGITIAASRTKAKATYVTLVCKNCKKGKQVPCRPGLGGAIVPRSCDHVPQDHLALMMELLGKMARKIATGGALSKDFFDRHGDLKRIRRLKFFPLDKLLIDKYKFSVNDAQEFSKFLLPLFDFSPEKRPTARQCLQHPWLKCPNEEENESAVNVGMSNLKIKGGK